MARTVTVRCACGEPVKFDTSPDTDSGGAVTVMCGRCALRALNPPTPREG